MTASQIIDEIAALSPEEQAKVVRYTRKLPEAERTQLCGKQLAALAEELAVSKDAARIKALREALTLGFYGHTSPESGGRGRVSGGGADLPPATFRPPFGLRQGGGWEMQSEKPELRLRVGGNHIMRLN